MRAPSTSLSLEKQNNANRVIRLMASAAGTGTLPPDLSAKPCAVAQLPAQYKAPVSTDQVASRALSIRICAASGNTVQI